MGGFNCVILLQYEILMVTMPIKYKNCYFVASYSMKMHHYAFQFFSVFIFYFSVFSSVFSSKGAMPETLTLFGVIYF